MLIKLGNNKVDKKKIFINSICRLFITENNLDICNNHAIEIKMKKTSVQDLKI